MTYSKYTFDDFIAGKALSNINELKGCCSRLAALSRLEKAEINLSLAEEVLEMRQQ